MKTLADGPLLARPRAGGDEKQVVEMVSNRGFVAVEDGTYYLTLRQESEIRFHAFSTGRSGTFSVSKWRPFLYLSVSPNRKTSLFTTTVSSEAISC